MKHVETMKVHSSCSTDIIVSNKTESRTQWTKNCLFAPSPTYAEQHSNRNP